MESRENPLFGRKIFFVNPTFNIEKYLIDYLRKNEYEVYILKEYKKVKRVLSVYPDSMCFIDIDEQLSYSEWYNYMKSFSLIPELQGIYLGIVTQNATWEDKDKFLMNVRLPCGFTLISKQEKILEHFAAILDLNGAKGRRKYLRLDTRNEKDVSGYMTSEGKLYTINIKDISSVGFAITYKQELMSMFQKNTLLRNLCLSAGRKSMVCSCIVFNTQPNPDEQSLFGGAYSRIDRYITEVDSECNWYINEGCIYIWPKCDKGDDPEEVADLWGGVTETINEIIMDEGVEDTPVIIPIRDRDGWKNLMILVDGTTVFISEELRE